MEGWERDKESDTKKELLCSSTSIGAAERHHGPRPPKRPMKEEAPEGTADRREDNNEAGHEDGPGGENGPLPSRPTKATEHVEFWDKLR